MTDVVGKLKKALNILDTGLQEGQLGAPISFDEYLRELSARPRQVLRNVFQIYHDMVKNYVGEGVDEYPDDPESIHYVFYDCSSLLAEGTDRPFFADRLFANRLISHAEAMRRGAQQNKIYIFEGPHGSGKSTFLNNLLRKFEAYANTDEGMRYETVWRLDRKTLGGFTERELNVLMGSYAHNNLSGADYAPGPEGVSPYAADMGETIDVPCVSHDPPFLLVPRKARRQFFDELFKNDEFKWHLFTDKEYEWVFRDNPCTICSSLYQALLSRFKTPRSVFESVFARPYQFDRRLGKGVSVFNPGDRPMKKTVLTNDMIQGQINRMLRDSNQVKYVFSTYANTNNGIYALMDIKSHNTERLIELHNVISEGVHKVEDVEENVNSLFMALMNPEDKVNIEDVQSFSDRIEYIRIPYVMDLNTEVEIYRNIFGRHIEESFLPRVLHNFARVIISTRLKTTSEAMLEWIGNPTKYRDFCDANLQLLKMEIYTGYIPSWLTEEDRKRLTARRRRRILGESQHEGAKGISGRDSIKMFNEFYSTYAKEGRLINMSIVSKFFKGLQRKGDLSVPNGFLSSLERMYNYTVLQEVKESLYFYNEEQIARDIQNYIFAVNFEPGSQVKCQFTGDQLSITGEFLSGIEARLLGGEATEYRRDAFRSETQREYTSRTLPQEILIEGAALTATKLFSDLKERYVYNLKEKVLEPFLGNENFRRAVADYGKKGFRTYDKRIQDDVTYLIGNLTAKYRYSQLGAKEVSMYVIDRYQPILENS
jgi:predicted Ser/Thr protein kinase